MCAVLGLHGYFKNPRLQEMQLGRPAAAAIAGKEDDGLEPSSVVHVNGISYQLCMRHLCYVYATNSTVSETQIIDYIIQ